MEVAALTIYLVWMLLAFGLRTLLQLRRTGDSGLRLEAEPNTPQFWARISFFIALVTGLAAPVAAVAGLENLTAFRSEALHAVGVVVAVAGVALTFAAQQAMGLSWRIGVDPNERTALVTDGAFAIVRNPIFTAMLIASLGLAMMIPNVVGLAALFAFIVSLEVQVRLVEEPYLTTVHGDTYDQYRQRVGRFFPHLT